jgi:hypothetical protein
MSGEFKAASPSRGLRAWMPDSWADCVVFALFVIAAYSTLPVVVVGVLSVTIAPIRSLLLNVGGWLLIAPLLLDLTSTYMHVTYLFGRTREHGQAGLAWFYYVPYCLVGLSVAWWMRLVVLAGLTLFHAVCQYYAPRYLATKLGWRPREGEREGHSS